MRSSLRCKGRVDVRPGLFRALFKVYRLIVAGDIPTEYPESEQ